MVTSGLINHGWTYINIDDTWQGNRGGKYNAIQGNEKFPDMKKLCDDIHAMGLKAGIYSTPWITSYAKFRGGSSDDPPAALVQGHWPTTSHWRHGKYSVRRQRRQAMGRLGLRLPEIRLEPERRRARRAR